MTNIHVVDTIVRQTEALFTEFYGDEDTAFVFTADHGMSVIGNHGDGGRVSIHFTTDPSADDRWQTRTTRALH